MSVGAATRVSLASTTAPAGADAGQDAEQIAKQNVELGARLYDQAKYAEALEAFERAAGAYPLPEFQYNIGLCHERLGNPREAIDAFEAYLQGKPDAPDAAGVRDRIEALRRQLDEPRSDAVPIEPTPRRTVDPRPAALSLQTRTTDERPRPQPSAPASEHDRTPEREGGRTMVVSGATLLGLGPAIGVAGGVAFGIYAERRSDEVDRIVEQGNPDNRTLADAREIAEQGDLHRSLQIASIATGVVVTITGVALVLAGRRRGHEVALAPAIGPRSAGLSLGGRL